MTSGAEKLFNQVHGIAPPPKQTPPMTVILPPVEPPKEIPMAKFWTLNMRTDKFFALYETKEKAIEDAKDLQAKDPENAPIFILEAVALVVRPITPRPEVTEL